MKHVYLDALTYILQNVVNYFEHPAIEETVIRTIFATPHSIGSRHSDMFYSFPTAVIALVGCAVRFTVVCTRSTKLTLYSFFAP